MGFVMLGLHLATHEALHRSGMPVVTASGTRNPNIAVAVLSMGGRLNDTANGHR